MIYTMMEACRETGMTYQGLKFYCNAGLVPNVKRDKINRRIFDENDIGWIKSLLRLRECGMSIAEIKEYMFLCLKGEASIPERKIMLSRTRTRLQSQIETLKKSIRYIDGKQEFYDEVLAGEREYFSNLLPCSCELDRQ
ncbi:MAG: MerR family transcriptional regulator [Synergistaceae bacterium]|nr:MerR family transcriptional regulator [Synergistaceae bacterium]